MSMNKRRKCERVDLRERLCHTLDISPDIFPGGTLIEMRGRNSVTLRGFGRVTHYSDSEISLACRDGELCIYGKRLCCSCYRRGCATVDGRIECVKWKERE